jgi:uncharacterized protein
LSSWIALVLPVALVGHAVFWVGLINRLHALGISRRTVKKWSAVCYTLLIGIPFVFAGWLLAGGELLAGSAPWGIGKSAAHGYLFICLLAAAAHLPAWFGRRLRRVPTAVVRHETRSVDVAARLERWPIVGLKARVLSRVPGNQLFHLDVDEEEIELPRLPAGLEGLSILHLSDTHFNRRIEPVYFREVVDLANELHPDMVAMTGDICDMAAAIPWVADVFGRLEGRLGKFFVLGNHDVRTRQVPKLRQAMIAAGFADVANCPQTLDVRGERLLVAGNERPWFASPDPMASPSVAAGGAPSFKLLLSHTPDQFSWARRRDFDLMLAGHTHGGQVCLPWIGPVVCPSLHGVRFAGGTFYSPPTLLHVSRGVSSLFPLRLSCPHEMTKLILRRAPTTA